MYVIDASRKPRPRIVTSSTGFSFVPTTEMSVARSGATNCQSAGGGPVPLCAYDRIFVSLSKCHSSASSSSSRTFST